MLILKKITRRQTVYREIIVAYFKNFYKDRWQKLLGLQNVTFIECGHPDPLEYGTENRLATCLEENDYFYVDEPLTSTLGISGIDEIEIVKKMISSFSIRNLKVKLHPRSSRTKFASLPEIELCDQIYLNSKYVFGYRSGLLDAPFSSKSTVYKLDPSTGTWINKELIKPYSKTYVHEFRQIFTDKL